MTDTVTTDTDTDTVTATVTATNTDTGATVTNTVTDTGVTVTDTVTDTTTLTEVESAEQADRLVRESDYLLLGFKAPWCPQCAPQRGVVQRVCVKFARVKFAYLDLGADESGAQAFSVRALPTLLLFKRGEEAARLGGFTPAPKLISSLNALLADSAD